MRRQKLRWSCVFALAFGGWAAACGGAGDVGASGGECFPDGTCSAGLVCSPNNTCGSDVGPDPECRSVTVSNTSASEKTNAAFCFGLAYPEDNYGCQYDSDGDVTHCDGDETGYYVEWSETPEGTVGLVYDVYDDSFLGGVSQDTDGDFVLVFTALELTGLCTVAGETAQLCLWPLTGDGAGA